MYLSNKINDIRQQRKKSVQKVSKMEICPPVIISEDAFPIRYQIGYQFRRGFVDRTEFSAYYTEYGERKWTPRNGLQINIPAVCGSTSTGRLLIFIHHHYCIYY